MAEGFVRAWAVEGRGAPSLADSLREDHARLEIMLEDVDRLLVLHDWERAANHLDEYVRAIRRHILREEELVWPLVERRPETEAKAAVLRVEHRRIEDLLDAMRAALDRSLVPQYRELRRQYARVVALHQLREEEYLYPLAGALSDAAHGLRPPRS